MEFKVSLDAFEGPLDLMLHLVQKNKLDLMDLDLHLLAVQYIDYIESAVNLNLEVASEYLFEFSWLLEYTSKKMLPAKEDLELDEYEQDQKENLEKRLQEYQRYKKAAELLEKNCEVRAFSLERPRDSLVEEWSTPIEVLPVLDSWKLVKAMQRVIRRKHLLNPYETTMKVKELSVEERMLQLQAEYYELDRVYTLMDLCTDVQTLRSVIVTFLAVLELIHIQFYTFSVDERGELWIRRVPA